MNPAPTVYILDDEEPVRKSLQLLIRSEGLGVRCFASAQELLDALEDIGPGCLVLDVCMPDVGGLELHQTLRERHVQLPVIILTGHGDVATAVKAMKGGAADFLEKPFDSEELLGRIRECLKGDARRRDTDEWRAEVARRLSLLTPREREVMSGLVDGKRNKQIAADLNISTRTAELHRASVMEKLQAKSLSDVVRIALMAGNES